MQVVAVKAPGFGDNRKNTIRDIAIATGAQVFGDEAAEKEIKDCQFADFGMVGELTVTKDNCLMLNGNGFAPDIEVRCQQILSMMEDTSSGSNFFQKISLLSFSHSKFYFLSTVKIV